MSHFEYRTALFAGIWLVFLIAPLAETVHTTATTAAQRTVAIALTLLFAVVYVVGFGTMSTFPRSWPRVHKVALRWIALAAIALATTPFIGFWAVSFIPFLGALVAYTMPLRISATVIILTGCVASAAVWLTSSVELVLVSIIVFGWPFLLLILGALSQREDTETALRHDLELAQQREQIASDIHDLLGHTLTVINLKAEVARRVLDRDPAKAEAELIEISSLSRLSLAEVRSTVTRMKNPTFAGEVHAARRILETAGIQPHLPESLPHALAHEALFSWALRELTTNVVRHSGATHCWVFLTNHSLQVTDDGHGFTTEARNALADGLTGLAGLRRRTEDAGGNVTVKRAKGLTSVLVSMDNQSEMKEVMMP